MDWSALIWTIVWIVVGVIALGFIGWVTFAVIAAKNFKRVAKSFDESREDFFRKF